MDDRSISGIVHMFAGAAFAATSFRQHSIAIDAYSSEVFTASSAAAQTMTYRGILTELGVVQEVPTPVVTDSRATVLVARSKEAMKKSIYLMRRVLFLQECVEDEEIQVYSCKGKFNLADVFTKAVFDTTAYFRSRACYMGSRDVAV